MAPVIVSENIKGIHAATLKFSSELSDINERKEEISKEILRLEGCLLTFEGFRDAGIEVILPESEKNDNNQPFEMHQDSMRNDHERMDNHNQPFEMQQDSMRDDPGRVDNHLNHEDEHPHEQNGTINEDEHPHDQNGTIHEEEHPHEQNDTIHEKERNESDKTPLEELYKKYRAF